MSQKEFSTDNISAQDYSDMFGTPPVEDKKDNQVKKEEVKDVEDAK